MADQHKPVMRTVPPPHIVWSTDSLDLADPFQRKWYIQQVLLHGRAQDIRSLDLGEVASLLDDLNLPSHLYKLWKAFLEARVHAQGERTAHHLLERTGRDIEDV